MPLDPVWTVRLELIEQCTIWLRLHSKSYLYDPERRQIELIRDSTLEILTESNYKRLCQNFILLSKALGDSRYSYSQEYWQKYIRAFLPPRGD